MKAHRQGHELDAGLTFGACIVAAVAVAGALSLLNGCSSPVVEREEPCQPACELYRDAFAVGPDPQWLLTPACCTPSQFTGEMAVGVCVDLVDGGCK